MADLSIQFKVDFAKALLELEDIIRGEKSVLSRIVDVKETIVSGSNLVKGMRKRSIGKSGIIGPLISALTQTSEDYAAAILFATTGKRYWYRDLSPHQDEYHKLRADRLGYFKAIIPSDNHPWDLVTYIISCEIEGLDFEDIKDVGVFIKNLDDVTRFALIEDGVRVDLIIDGLEEDASEVVEQEQSKQIGRSGDESLDVGDVLERLYDGDLETNEWFLRMSAPQSQSALNPFEEHVPTELHDHERSVPITEISGRGTENRARQRYAKEQSIDELVQPAIFRRSFPVSEQTPGSEQANTVTTREIVGVLPGVGSALERHSKLISNQLANGTNNEQSSAAPPIPRPRPTLTPMTKAASPALYWPDLTANIGLVMQLN